MPVNRIHPLLFTPDSTSLIAGGWLGESRMWDVRSGEQRRVFGVPPVPKDGSEMIATMQLAPDGKRLTAMSLLVETTRDGVFKRQRYLTSWDVASGKQVNRRTLDLDNRIIFSLEGLSPDGRFAITYGGGGLLIYDVVAGRPVQVMAENIMAPVAFSADSKLLAFAGNFSPVKGMERVHIREMSSGSELLALAAGHAWERAFSPDGRYLLTASDGDLRLWELVSGKEVLRRHVATPVDLSGHPSFATCLVFAADGRSVAVGMPDTNVLIWDLAPATRSHRKLNAEDLDRLWVELASEDAAKAYRTAGTLIADPERTVPFLGQRLHPIKEDAPRIRKLVADLDSEQFAVRDAARNELEKMDDAAHAVLRQALKAAKSLETRRRIQSLLSDSWLVKVPDKLRQVRAVMVLEQIGNGAARSLLERLAEGAAEARQTREVTAALRRLTTNRR